MNIDSRKRVGGERQWGLQRMLIGIQLPFLFMGGISEPFCTVSGGLGDRTLLAGVGVRPCVALWI